MRNRPAPSLRRRARLRAPLALMLTTVLIACAACPFTPVESATPSDATTDAPAVWREVFGSLAWRADRGDAESARLALEMFRSAPQAYGERFGATPRQLQTWECRALRREPPCVPEAPAA